MSWRILQMEIHTQAIGRGIIMATATGPVADRLAFDWQPSTDPAYRWAVTITETQPRKRTADRVIETRYCVQEVERFGRGEGVGRLFLWAKAPDETAERSAEIYECFVTPDTHSCSCNGSQCRRHSLVCRHALAARAAIEQGEI